MGWEPWKNSEPVPLTVKEQLEQAEVERLDQCQKKSMESESLSLEMKTKAHN